MSRHGSIERALAELERERDLTRGELARLEQAIEALRGLTASANGGAAKGEVGSRLGAGNHTSRLRINWAEARRLWDEGLPAAEIAERLGVTERSVLNGAQYRKWPARERRGPLRPREGRETQRRRCEECQQLTARDPCEHCGAKWAGEP